MICIIRHSYCLLSLQEKFPRLCLNIESVMERMAPTGHEFCGGLRQGCQVGDFIARYSKTGEIWTPFS